MCIASEWYLSKSASRSSAETGLWWLLSIKPPRPIMWPPLLPLRALPSAATPGLLPKQFFESVITCRQGLISKEITTQSLAPKWSYYYHSTLELLVACNNTMDNLNPSLNNKSRRSRSFTSGKFLADFLVQNQAILQALDESQTSPQFSLVSRQAVGSCISS